MISEFINHWAAAIQLRTSMWRDVKRARKEGKKVPSNIRSLIWKTPQNQEEFIWLLRFIHPDEAITLIDIGGNSGYWAEAFQLYFPTTNVFGFEPVPEMFQLYQERFKKNKKVLVFNVALGNQVEHRQINVATGYGLTSFNMYSRELSDKNAQFKKSIEVPIEILNHYKDQINISPGSKVIIKVDVQGFETKVVQGGLDVFGQADIIIMECSFIDEFANELPTFGELVAALRELDLHPIDFGLFDRKASSAAFERNVLFVKSKFFQKIWNK